MAAQINKQLDAAELEAMQKRATAEAQAQGLIGPWSVGGEGDTVETLGTITPDNAASQLGFLQAHWSGRTGSKTYDPPFSVTPDQHAQMVAAQKGYVGRLFDWIKQQGDRNG